MNIKIKNIFLTALKALVTVAALISAIVALEKYDYLSRLDAIDNFTAISPIGLMILAVGCFSTIIWMKHSKRLLPFSISLAVILILSIALYPNAVIGNWWLGGNSKPANIEPDISVYAPFTGSQTVSLDAQANLLISDDLPVMDGATAFYPMYAAFAQAVYDQNSYADEYVICSKTNKAYDSIIAGSVDLIFVLEPSLSQKKAAEEAGADLKFHKIGREAFVFIVSDENPTDNLTYEQLQNIYSGKTAKWGTLGWKEGGDMIVFQRPEGSGSQTGLQKIMKDTPIHAPRPLPDESLIGTNSLMQQVTVEWNGVHPAIGYSYRFFAETMFPNPHAKLLSINGISPTIENIRNDTYPFVFDFYAVTNGEPVGNTKKLIDWIKSDQGKELTERAGFVAL